jgi:hypothetical protein
MGSKRIPDTRMFEPFYTQVNRSADVLDFGLRLFLEEK